MDGLSVVCRVGSDMIMICTDRSTVTLCAHTGNLTGNMNWKLHAPSMVMMTHHGHQGLACWHTYLTNMQSPSPKQTISLSAHIYVCLCVFSVCFHIFIMFVNYQVSFSCGAHPQCFESDPEQKQSLIYTACHI